MRGFNGEVLPFIQELLRKGTDESVLSGYVEGLPIVNVIALAIRTYKLRIMRVSKIAKKNSVEKILPKLYKFLKVNFENRMEITTESRRSRGECWRSIQC